MTHAQDASSTDRKPLRLWPGVVIVVLQWLARFGVPLVAPDALTFGVMSGLAGGVLVLVWWVFFSRAPWSERLGAVVLVAAALVVTPFVLHVSMATAAQGLLFPIYAVPALSLALVVWAVAARQLADGLRRATLVVAVLLACGVWTLVRTTGVTGGFEWEFAWRWTETAEERLLALTDDTPASSSSAAVAPGADAPEWPGFRGPDRDGVVSGVRIATDWSASPPKELWRRPIGPGWGSFAVQGERLYTQEQRGDEEVVSCYDAGTGEPIWQHRDAVRFWEAMAGPGPRTTPTLGNGRVYALGTTGILNVLEAGDGALVWTRDAASDTGVELPIWGFSGSPWVTEDAVFVALAGRLAAYDADTGEPRWLSQEMGTESYGSPHRVTIDGVEQVLLMNGKSLISVAPADGAQLWEHSWSGFHSLQPALTANGDVLMGNSGNAAGLGTRRLAVVRGSGGWRVEEGWTSRGLKPYFNDFVVHEGHAYGFDGRILSCLDLTDGERKWKGGRFGHGQLVLLADQDLLLVLSEKGELGLVGATPGGFDELARFQAIEGKTWNHPVVVGDVVLVRNAEEMAAFRLAPADG